MVSGRTRKQETASPADGVKEVLKMVEEYISQFDDGLLAIGVENISQEVAANLGMLLDQYSQLQP